MESLRDIFLTQYFKLPAYRVADRLEVFLLADEVCNHVHFHLIFIQGCLKDVATCSKRMLCMHEAPGFSPQHLQPRAGTQASDLWGSVPVWINASGRASGIKHMPNERLNASHDFHTGSDRSGWFAVATPEGKSWKERIRSLKVLTLLKVHSF